MRVVAKIDWLKIYKMLEGSVRKKRQKEQREPEEKKDEREEGEKPDGSFYGAINFESDIYYKKKHALKCGSYRNSMKEKKTDINMH